MQTLKENNSQSSVLYTAEVSFRNEGEINTLVDKAKLREFVFCQPTYLKRMAKKSSLKRNYFKKAYRNIRRKEHSKQTYGKYNKLFFLSFIFWMVFNDWRKNYNTDIFLNVCWENLKKIILYIGKNKEMENAVIILHSTQTGEMMIPVDSNVYIM